MAINSCGTQRELTKGAEIMMDLRNLLELLLNEATFDIGREEGDGVSYGQHPENRLGPTCLGAIFKQNKWNNRLPLARRARLVCPPHYFAEFKDTLRIELGEYVDSDADSVGHVLPICRGQTSSCYVGPGRMLTVCAGQRPDQVGSSPTDARVRGVISKSGGNASLAGVIG